MTKPYKITFCGDTSLGYSYLERSKKLYPETYDRLMNNPGSFFDGVTSIINGSDELIVNLETVLTDSPGMPVEGKEYPSYDDPTVSIDLLKRIGVTAVTLANNHTVDFGKEKLMDMIDRLENSGISVIGAGKNYKEAIKPYHITIDREDGVKNIYIFNGFRETKKYTEYGFYATEDSPGVASDNLELMSSEIQSLKSKDPDCTVIVCPHWQGIDYQDTKARHQVWCRAIIDAGADHVVAHGTHKADRIEQYGGGIIFYSIGNFIFNSPGRYQALGVDSRSLIVSLSDVDGNQHWKINEIMSDNKATGFNVEAYTPDSESNADSVITIPILPERKTEQAIFKGQVQRVGFRNLLKSCAKELSIDGWVRNLNNGSVEALVKGTEKALGELYAKILLGEDKYKVTDLSRRASSAQVEPGFMIRGTVRPRQNEGMDKEEYLRLVSDLYEDPRNPSHPLDLAQKVTDTLNKKAKEFYKSRITRKSIHREFGYSQDQLSTLIERAQPNQLSHQMLRFIERRKIPVRRALSFHTIMMQNSQERSLGIPVLGWNVDHKTKAYEFADKIGLQRPDCNSKIYRFSEIEQPSKPTVLKPVKSTGSRGVAFYFDKNNIRLLRGHISFSSWEEFTEYTNKEVLRSETNSAGVRDRWMTEELILEDSKNMVPARDLKFYSFYGKVFLILEIIRNKEVHHCFWSRDGKQIKDSGQYRGETWEGDGVSEQQIQEVEKISLQIPVPFIRIDMLKGEDGMVFGEFTPRPGQWDRFNLKYDRLLGQEYARAESRLFHDLLNGKQFPHYPI